MSPKYSAATKLLTLLLIPILAHAMHVKELQLPEDLRVLYDSQDKRDLQLGSYRRNLRCIDMLSVEGSFTFTSSEPGQRCALFLIANPDETLLLHYTDVNIDCDAGDSLTVFDGWVMKRQTFPGNGDYPLPAERRSRDFCRGLGSLQRTFSSSQNVAMILFNIATPGQGFTVAVRKALSHAPCNAVSPSADGVHTLALPPDRASCSFSIIYPVALELLAMRDKGASAGDTAGHGQEDLQQLDAECDAGAFVQVLGGNGLNPSTMNSLATFCSTLSSPVELAAGCEHTVVRLVGKPGTRAQVTFSFRRLTPNDTGSSHARCPVPF
ncbi:corticotropin-releasing factor-binding protein [Lampetra fluviatilis]